MTLKTLILKPNEEKRLAAGHLWIFSNEIDTNKSPLKNFAAGELCVVTTARDKKIGLTYVNPHTLLCARLLSTDHREIIDINFFLKRLATALKIREKIFTSPFYRLVYSESDLLPGLIIDRFGDVLIVQTNTAGMENQKKLIIDALQELLQPRKIILKNDSNIREVEGLAKYTEVVGGDASEENIIFDENGAKFQVALGVGQKTGWFFDQRENRNCVAKHCVGKRVLDVFSYCGGFGITGAKYGAKEVLCVDSSQPALELLEANVKLNNLAGSVHTLKGDAFTILEELTTKKEKFEVIILDPPAFAKSNKDIKQAALAYEKINALALNLLEDNGILATFSCSLHMSRDELMQVLRKAAIKSSSHLRVIEQLHQDKDHPLHPAIHETNYLKGFVAIKG